jgi:hypothetical protein
MFSFCELRKAGAALEPPPGALDKVHMHTYTTGHGINLCLDLL